MRNVLRVHTFDLAPHNNGLSIIEVYIIPIVIAIKPFLRWLLKYNTVHYQRP